MPMPVRLTFVLCLSFVLAASEAREWDTRDGKHTVEAELLTAENGVAVLRREDGSVVRVPLERLSYADVKYVYDAIQVAGMATPSTSAIDADRPASDPPDFVIAPGGPPLADPTSSKWQVVADPGEPPLELAPDAKFEIAIESPTPLVVYPTTPSPFVVLAGNMQKDPRQLWDLRSGTVVGEIRELVGQLSRVALSPDGQHLAVCQSEKVHIWSFVPGEGVQRIDLENSSSRTEFLDFAGDDRIIFGESGKHDFAVHDIHTGKKLAGVQVQPLSSNGARAVSPGGRYLAAYCGEARRLGIYDTRNGLRAAWLKTDEDLREPTSLAFSSDGRELAAWYSSFRKQVMLVWDLTSGKQVVAHHFEENPRVEAPTYKGRALQWLTDGSGWLFYGAAIMDRESGQVVWRDEAPAVGSRLLPRSVVDQGHMLVFRGGDENTTVSLVPLPAGTIAAARATIAAGGNATDAGKPPISRVDSQSAREVHLTSTTGDYEPVPVAVPSDLASRERLDLGPGTLSQQWTFFSDPSAARVAVCELPQTGSAADRYRLPEACRLIDLRSGQPVARFEIPFQTELMDLSPQGNLGLFRIAVDRDRLDIWDLSTGTPVIAFRPYQDWKDRNRRISHARFIDETHIVTISEAGQLMTWELPACRAVYRCYSATATFAGLSRDRKMLLLFRLTRPYLLDALSGEMVTALETAAGGNVLANPREALLNPRGLFSLDQDRLVVLFSRVEGCTVAFWNMRDGKRLHELTFPFDVSRLTWCGPGHVLLQKGLQSDGLSPMIDAEQGRVVWNYRLNEDDALWSSPDRRFWCLHGATSSGKTALAALELPDEQVKSVLAKVSQPEPLLGAGASVALQTLIEDPPQNLPEGWPELEDLNESIHTLFSQQLQKRQVHVTATGSVRLTVGIRSEEVEGAMAIGEGYRPPRTLKFSITKLEPYAALLDSKGNTVWEADAPDDFEKLPDFRDCPKNLDVVTYVNLKRWQAAAKWLRSVQIPMPIYPPTVQRGLGESVIGPNGIEIRRSPSPSEVKPRDRTAGAPFARADRQS